MKYGSVCSGVEAATTAWHPLGWECQWVSEIEPYPSAVLKHHYPDVPNLGDMTKIRSNDVFRQSTINVLVGGTPCQSFSVAGLRKGLADPRGNLALEFLAIADAARPEWILWENVPGVLSSWSDEKVCAPTEESREILGNEGLDPRDFEQVEQSSDLDCFLTALAELGYGWAYRTLDAQYFGVAQRRRRVFVVGCLGSRERAAAVLLERESLSGNPPPGREKRKGASQDAGQDAAEGGRDWPTEVSPALYAKFGEKQGMEDQNALGSGGMFVPDVAQTLTRAGAQACDPETEQLLPVMSSGQANAEVADNVSPTLNCNQDGAPIAFMAGAGANFDPGYDEDISPTLKAADSGSNRTPAVAIPIHEQAIREKGGGAGRADDGKGNGLGVGEDGDPANTLTAGQGHAVAFKANAGTEFPGADPDDVSPTLQAENPMAVAHAFKERSGKEGGGKGYLGQDEAAFTLSTNQDQAVAFGQPVDTTGHQGDRVVGDGDVHPALSAQGGNNGGGAGAITADTSHMAVRRLTPTECERLQGFPDGYTAIPWNGKPADQAPDGPRYKAMGNSMAVPVMRWIAERIEQVSKIPRSE